MNTTINRTFTWTDSGRWSFGEREWIGTDGRTNLHVSRRREGRGSLYTSNVAVFRDGKYIAGLSGEYSCEEWPYETRRRVRNLDLRGAKRLAVKLATTFVVEPCHDCEGSCRTQLCARGTNCFFDGNR